MWVLFGVLALVSFVMYFLTARNPGKVETPEDLKKLDKNPQFHMEAKTDQINRQLTHFEAQTRKVAAVDALENAGTRLEEQEQLRRATHTNAILAQNLLAEHQKANTRLVGKAAEQNLDLPTFQLMRRDQESAHLDVWKHGEMKRIDLDGKAQEIQMEITAAMTVSLAEKHKVLHIQDQVLGLITKAHQIQNGNDPEEVKKAKLDVMNEVITGLRKELRGLLQGDNRQGPEDDNAAAVS